MKCRYVYMVIPLLMVAIQGFAGESKYFVNGGIAFEIGIWKPVEIDPYPSKPLTNIEGADPIAGITVFSPTVWGSALQLSALQWRQRGLLGQTSVESVQIRQVAVNIKHLLVSQTRICPYVTYGINFFWPKQNPSAPRSEGADYLSSAKVGANVGAGVDIAFFRHGGIAAEYQYIYVEFDDPIGLTSNYSGPKLAVKLLLVF